MIAVMILGLSTASGQNQGVPQALDELALQFDGINQFLIDINTRINTLESVTVVNGTDGVQGIQGIAGIDGQDGAQGIQGESGIFNTSSIYTNILTRTIGAGGSFSFDSQCDGGDFAFNSGMGNVKDLEINTIRLAPSGQPPNPVIWGALVIGTNPTNTSIDIDVIVDCLDNEEPFRP